MEGDSKVNASKIYPGSGVYILRKGKIVVYVGMSRNVRSRVKSHTVRDFDSVEVIKCGEEERCKLESRLIKKYKPKYNGMSMLGKRQIRLSKDQSCEIKNLIELYCKKTGLRFSIAKMSQMALTIGIKQFRKQLK